MNYEEARQYLKNLSAAGSIPGLDAIRALLERLGNPQDSLHFIHIAGTNGKGSVMAFLDNILIEAGYKTGRYHSPSLFSYEEEFLIGGKPIATEKVAALITRIARAREELVLEGKPAATVFEVETALSFLWFAEEKVDLVLLECGMGGALDATNIVRTTLIELFSSISMDHMQFLGNTLSEIARNKSGIIKPGTEVLTDTQKPEALAELKRTADQQKAHLEVLHPDDLKEVTYGLTEQSYLCPNGQKIRIRLPGVVQIHNSYLAIRTAEKLQEMGWDIPAEAIQKGCEQTSWPGRFTLVHENPTVIMDGAHNPGAAKMLMESLHTYFPEKKAVYVFGIFADKNYREVIRLTLPLASAVYTVETPDNPRALPAERLAAAIQEAAGSPDSLPVVPMPDIPGALERAMQDAGRDGIVLAFGSLSWLHLVRDFFMH